MKNQSRGNTYSEAIVAQDTIILVVKMSKNIHLKKLQKKKKHKYFTM